MRPCVLELFRPQGFLWFLTILACHATNLPVPTRCPDFYPCSRFLLVLATGLSVLTYYVLSLCVVGRNVFFCRYHSQRCLMKEELVADCTRKLTGRWSAPMRLAQGYPFQSASSLWLALSLRERSTGVCEIRRSRDCLHHTLKEASLWASALAAASLRLRARAAASEGVGESLGHAVTFSLGSSTVPGAPTLSPPLSLPASMQARRRLFLPLRAPCGMPVESRWGLPSIPGHALARAFTCPTKTASS